MCCSCWSGGPDQPAAAAESPEQRVARALAEGEALAARAEAVLAAQAAAPPLPVPYFKYAAHGGGPPGTVPCSTCQEPRSPGATPALQRGAGEEQPQLPVLQREDGAGISSDC
ncbi:hypothetical protein SEVIR_4G114566v4 [Setaria viridis]